jgi:hypothetical protein
MTADVQSLPGRGAGGPGERAVDGAAATAIAGTSAAPWCLTGSIGSKPPAAEPIQPGIRAGQAA